MIRQLRRRYEVHVPHRGEDGYSAEVFNALGETIAVITVPESALEPPRVP